MRRPAVILASIALAACSRSGAPAAPAPAGAPPAAPAAATATRSADPSTLRYSAGTNRYRIETQQHVVQEMMGSSQVIDGTTTQLVTVTMAPQGADLGLTVVFDSIAITTTAPGGASAGAAASRALMGKRVTGTLTPAGRITALSSPDSAQREVAQAMTAIRDFLPLLPASPLTPGREWTDTTTTSQALDALTMNTRSVRTHRVDGWETRDGMRALKVTTRSSYTISGSGDAQGNPIELAGSGSAMTERFVSAGGVFLGAVESDSAQINVNVVSMGMSIPVTRTQRATVTRLP